MRRERMKNHIKIIIKNLNSVVSNVHSEKENKKENNLYTIFRSTSKLFISLNMAVIYDTVL